MRAAARVQITEATEATERVLGLSRAVWGDALLAWGAQRVLLVVLMLLWRGLAFHNIGSAWWRAAYEPWTGYDGQWYASIAVAGYSRLPQAAFFPLYPLLEHLAAPLALGHVLLAGLLISNAAGLVAFALLRQLVEEEVSAAVARRTLSIVAFFPTSFYLMMAYTESLFLALSLGAFLALRRRSWLVTGVLITLATLTRSTGILLLVPLGLEALVTIRERRVSLPGWHDWRWAARVAAGAALPLAALAAWYLYLDWHFGANGAISRALNDPVWQRHLDWPWHGLFYSFGVLLHGGRPNEVFDLTRDLVFTLVWIGCTVALFHTSQPFPRRYASYALATLVLALTFPMHAHPYDALSSVPRYLLAAFPCFVLVARWSLASRRFARLIWSGNLALLTCFVAIIAAGGFIA